MNERAHELVERFERANAELRAVIDGCSEEQWRRRSEDEGWSVAVSAYHVANGYDQEGRVERAVRAVIAGAPLPPPPGPGYADEQAARFADCTQEETLALLDHNAAVAGRLLHGLRDDELDTPFPTAPGRPPRALG
jgi:hypothetical protein